VSVKGQGILNSGWLIPSSVDYGLAQQNKNHDSTLAASGNVAPNNMLVDWICELLFVQMEKLAVSRKKSSLKTRKILPVRGINLSEKTPMDEVVEVLLLPEYKNCTRKANIPNPSKIDTIVKVQLHQYISAVASMYHNNPFHNFEHACHVTMSVNKLLMRIVTPDLEVPESADAASHLHHFTHGINSDPITILAIIFSAVIHDADHRGISNTQLMKEDVILAKRYNDKSIAEQNSVDMAWSLFVSDDFITLREFLFETSEELKRFRQVLVNVVLATDIFDKELNSLRKSRWEKAFTTSSQAITSRECHSLRATIVIEHLIQASDVSHTMQHWHVYRKWNCKLFQELHQAYREGRMAANPADFWYQGELGFFDNYIIPLAKKLKDCRVFGVSSDEYLNYAENNRAEWEARGQEIVVEMMSEIH
jgi:3'5'-cyclic nucleotide phosphodiesterase